MALTIGTRLGSHEITALLGKGGMGEVYRARDLKLKREVAIKILPEEFSRDADRVSRFQREAEVLASLNHPNIAAIHDLEETDGTRYLVLELVEGGTLAERIASGPIPVEEALNIAIQICEALEAAHERGIIHRDLKPANVKITPDGKIKVLDFGLAKAMENAPANPTLSNSPTMLSGTMGGMILGTAAYMSPEQAKGRPVDRRTDIFAFGCVLFEMITGHPAFKGDDLTEILGRVVTAEPDWNKLPTETPPIIRRLVRRALWKDPRQRLGDIRDARLDIEEAISEPVGDAKREDSSQNRKVRGPWIAASVAVVTAAALAIPAVRYMREVPAPDAPEMHLEITTPLTRTPAAFALSPDGRYIAFAASGDGPQRLWLRSLDKTGARPLPGTENADDPFWSADSRSIGFYASGKLKRIDIGGGVPQVLADTVTPLGGAWNAEGTIIFSTGTGPLSRIGASGGDPVPITRTGPTQIAHRFPNFLPDGRHFVYYSAGRPEVTGIYLASLDGGEAKRLAAADTSGLYLPPDMIAYGRGTSLLAQHLDLKRSELTGDVLRLSDFSVSTVLGEAGLSVSSDGRIAFRGTSASRGRLRWYDRSGKETGIAGEPAATQVLYPELSPDGRQVAVMLNIQGNSDIWLMDLVRGGMTRFTTDAAADLAPIWSPDGTRIAFASNRKGAFDLYMKPSNGVGAEEVQRETPNTKFTQDWSKDARFLLYLEIDLKTGRDLWALPVTGNDRTPIPVARTAFEEQSGQFSPDGHWIAYETNESGQFQVVVQPFPEPTGRWPVSIDGGTQPRWRADGKELYFIAPDGKLMVVSISVQGQKFTPGPPVALFPALLVTGSGANRQEYAVSSDGRFLVNQAAEASTTTSITIILNWRHEHVGK
jgi:serine/threonine protein kinase/Tol biopolymer transport system component